MAEDQETAVGEEGTHTLLLPTLLPSFPCTHILPRHLFVLTTLTLSSGKQAPPPPVAGFDIDGGDLSEISSGSDSARSEASTHSIQGLAESLADSLNVQ
jgi:hypothetical protein